jgi:superfamily I DNA and/or RNA helicase
MSANETQIVALLKDADKKEEEFNAEKGTLDTLLLNGSTMASLIDANEKPGSGAGKYKKFLENQIDKTKKNIGDLKNDDKFYRRGFLEGKPLTIQPNAFWKNTDNIILTVFWSAIIAILIPITVTILNLPISSDKKTLLVLFTWIITILFLLYLLQFFG